VQPKNVLESDEDIHRLMLEFKQLPQVDIVQVDMQWVDRMQTLMILISRAVYLVAILLGVALVFITGNTIRLELHSRQDEVYISKLVGATQSFIQRPFLYSGFWLGFLAAVIAWLIMCIMLLLVETPVEKLSTLYNSTFELQYLGFTETVILILASSGLAVMGAFGVLQYQLRQLKPE
jgi:cell division transport system permease protein